MGNKYEVWAWVKTDNKSTLDAEYMYEIKYAGDDFEEAMTEMKRLKSAEVGVGCVKFYWR